MNTNFELILKTLVSFALIGVGFWGISEDQKVLGIICIIAGIIIGVSLYGDKFNWTDWWR